jgi:hypothetical protein
VAVGVFPGSFNPPTVAHLAIARAALEQCGLERVDLVLSHGALGKDDGDLVAIEDRAFVLKDVAATRPWLGVRVVTERFIADIAEGYDVVIVGADKWEQVIDPSWYGDDVDRRDEILRRLPTVAGVRRPGSETDGVDVLLDVHEVHLPVSASEVREGRVEWMLPEAVDFDARTGAWSDATRYSPWRNRMDDRAGGS